MRNRPLSKLKPDTSSNVFRVVEVIFMKWIGMGLFILALSLPAAAQDPDAHQQDGEHARTARGRNLSQMDSNHDGKISRDEWRGPADGFSRLDANNDGFITREELGQARRKLGRKMDTDNDGRISRQEWQGTAEMFERLDSNHDGFVTRDEIRKSGLGLPGPRRAAKNFSGMDSNGDGRVSKDEWKGPAALFDRLDADRDGFVTRDELQNRSELRK
jgi:Ca2+-binding EF-hand superfamily protein